MSELQNPQPKIFSEKDTLNSDQIKRRTEVLFKIYSK